MIPLTWGTALIPHSESSPIMVLMGLRVVTQSGIYMMGKKFLEMDQICMEMLISVLMM